MSAADSGCSGNERERGKNANEYTRRTRDIVEIGFQQRFASIEHHEKPK
jgi:hypothetical protein